MKKRIIIAVSAVAILALALAGCGKKDESAKIEETKVTPTLMYFVSANDANYDTEKTTFEELEKEYEGKVNFNMINVDENPQALENFAMVKDNTPYAITLNTENNLSGMKPQVQDKSELEELINKALSE